MEFCVTSLMILPEPQILYMRPMIFLHIAFLSLLWSGKGRFLQNCIKSSCSSAPAELKTYCTVLCHCGVLDLMIKAFSSSICFLHARLILIGNFVEQGTTQCKQKWHYNVLIFLDAQAESVPG